VRSKRQRERGDCQEPTEAELDGIRAEFTEFMAVLAMTLAKILARLDALEARLAAPPVEIDLRDVRRQLALISERRMAMPGYRPCGVSVAELIEKAREAATEPRFTREAGKKPYPRPTA
jgi:hypothetical protein